MYFVEKGHRRNKKNFSPTVNLLPVLLFISHPNKVKGIDIVRKALSTSWQLTDLSAGWTGHTVGSIWIHFLMHKMLLLN